MLNIFRPISQNVEPRRRRWRRSRLLPSKRKRSRARLADRRHLPVREHQSKTIPAPRVLRQLRRSSWPSKLATCSKIQQIRSPYPRKKKMMTMKRRTMSSLEVRPLPWQKSSSKKNHPTQSKTFRDQTAPKRMYQICKRHWVRAN